MHWCFSFVVNHVMPFRKEVLEDLLSSTISRPMKDGVTFLQLRIKPMFHDLLQSIYVVIHAKNQTDIITVIVLSVERKWKRQDIIRELSMTHLESVWK